MSLRWVEALRESSVTSGYPRVLDIGLNGRFLLGGRGARCMASPAVCSEQRRKRHSPCRGRPAQPRSSRRGCQSSRSSSSAAFSESAPDWPSGARGQPYRWGQRSGDSWATGWWDSSGSGCSPSLGPSSPRAPERAWPPHSMLPWPVSSSSSRSCSGVFPARVLGATLAASVCATAVARVMAGPRPELAVRPTFSRRPLTALPGFMLLGLAAGLLAMAYNTGTLKALKTLQPDPDAVPSSRQRRRRCRCWSAGSGVARGAGRWRANRRASSGLSAGAHDRRPDRRDASAMAALHVLLRDREPGRRVRSDALPGGAAGPGRGPAGARLGRRTRRRFRGRGGEHHSLLHRRGWNRL